MLTLNVIIYYISNISLNIHLNRYKTIKIDFIKIFIKKNF